MCITILVLILYVQYLLSYSENISFIITQNQFKKFSSEVVIDLIICYYYKYTMIILLKWIIIKHNWRYLMSGTGFRVQR